MRRFVYSFPLLFLAACGGDSDAMARYHEDGRAKPVVAVAAMIDTTACELPWSLSEEITARVAGRMAHSGELFVEAVDDFSPQGNPFGRELGWVKKEFPMYEFALFFELAQHETVPATKGRSGELRYDLSSNLNMEVRFRVLDLRGESPKVVLQEKVRESYFIPKTLLPVDYQTISWGSEEFAKTPMGIAHAQLSEQIVERVRDYILLAKSR